MPKLSDTARIPAELEHFRAALVLGEHATGVEIIDRSLAAVVERAQLQAEQVAARQKARPTKQEVHDAKVWENFLAFQRMMEERPLGTRGKHYQRAWDLRGGRKQAPGGQGLAGRSPGEHVIATRQSKIEWLRSILAGARANGHTASWHVTMTASRDSREESCQRTPSTPSTSTATAPKRRAQS